MVRGGDLETHEVAVLGFALVVRLDRPFLEVAPVDRLDCAAAARVLAKDAEQAVALLGELTDRLGDVGDAALVLLGQALESREHAVAGGERQLLSAPALGFENAHARRRPVLRPTRWPADEVAARVGRGDENDRCRGERAFLLEAFAVPRERTLVRHLGEQPLQRDAVGALHTEGARELSLARLLGCVGEILDDLVLGREAAAAGGFRCLGHGAL